MAKYDEPWNSNKSKPATKGLELLELLRSNRVSLIVMLGLLALWVFYLTCTTYIGPGEFGIKQVLYSPFGLFGPMGTQKTVYETGIHHQFPTMEKILRFPKTIQVLTMRDNPDPREKITETISATDEKFTRIVKAAYIQTSDGFYVKMDTWILYCIEDPVKLVNMVGAGKLYEDNGILPVAENAIKVRLGTLQPEDFFDAKIRVAKSNTSLCLISRIAAMSQFETQMSKVQRDLEQRFGQMDKQTEKAAERAARSAERAKRKAERAAGWWRFSFGRPPFPPTPPSEPVSDQERLLILKMVKEGKISVDQAAQLLSALES